MFDSNNDENSSNDDCIEDVFTDQVTDIITSSTENHSNSMNVGKSQPLDIDACMQHHLNNEDRINDGIVSASGVVKSQQLYSEMKTFTWTDCLYKCLQKCNRRVNFS